MSSSPDPFVTYQEEAAELLAELELSLLSLEADPHDTTKINEAFRALHTIKGSGAMLDLETIVNFAHRVESVFDLLRSGAVGVTAEIIEASLAAKDALADLVKAGKSAVESDATQEIRSRFDRLVPQAHIATHLPPAAPLGDSPGRTGGTDEPRASACYQVHFSPDPQAFLTGSNPLLVLQELSRLGEILILCSESDLPPLSRMEPERCYLSWDLLLCTTADENAIHDAFIFSGEATRLTVAAVDEGASVHDVIMSTRVGEILMQRNLVSPGDVDQALERQGLIGEALVASGCVANSDVIRALREQKLRRESVESSQEHTTTPSIKVSTEKLDELVNLVGEFVSTQSAVLLHAAARGDSALRALAERLEDQVRRLRELSMEMHLVPVENLFTSFRRVVRDLSTQLNKRVTLAIDGADTELDKNLVDALRDPLVHLIRNAVDHGIETPQERAQAGKDPEGALTLAARYVGSSVEIDVSDDGRGIDLEAIRRRAAERGLIDAGTSLTDEEVRDLIFRPGFSTAEQTTSVSGRGVGMDVVRKNVEGVGGTVRITSGEHGGTIATLRIPLTMAIVDGVLARIGGGYYFVNVSHVVECLDAEAFGVSGTYGVIDLRGEMLPYYDLRDFFDLSRQNGEASQVLVVESDEERLGLVVDSVEDNYQSVIKPLGRLFDGLEGISGAIILGDGTPALMLDTDRLIGVTRKELDTAGLR